MPCHHFIELKIDDYLTGRLGPDDKSHFDEIIGQCPDCRRFFEDQKEAYGLISRVPGPRIEGTYWTSLEKSILTQVGDREAVPPEESPAEDGRGRGIWPILVPLAASFLIFLVSLSLSDKTGPSPGTQFAAASTAENNGAEQTSYARLIENQEIVAISYITTSPPGTFGF